ncbi:MAG: cytochrome c oxidase subunit II [Cyclobacteriaceae bacterium]|nr:cytochrome c oxidase subunit II [Cyclobacteriaceae bacterium]
MMSLIIGLGVVLVLAILYLIFRIGNLVGLVKGREEESTSWNSVNAYLLMLFMILGLIGFFWYSFVHFDSYNLPVASEHGEVTDYLFWVTMAVTVVAFVLIFIAMFWFTFKYRYEVGRKAVFFADDHKLEIVWTVVPAIVLALLIFSGLRAWNDITGPASKDAVVIELIGQQFLWTARYPGTKDKQLGKHNYKMIDASNEFGLDLSDKNTFDDFKSLELHLPKGQEVQLMIRAKDVLHSVFLPHFRLKMDAVPGMHTTFKFVATKSTADMRAETGNPNFNYEMACTEICGRGHFSMRFPVFVHDSVEDYEKWMASQEAWLKQNPEYLQRVPAELREAAIIKAGIPADSKEAILATPVTVTLN